MKYKKQATKDKTRVTEIVSSLKFTFILFLCDEIDVACVTLIISQLAYIWNDTIRKKTQKTKVAASEQGLAFVEKGKKIYRLGRLAEAVKVLQQAARAFKASGQVLGQAIALANLSLADRQLGQWTEAKEAIACSVQLISQQDKSPASCLAIAQAKLFSARKRRDSTPMQLLVLSACQIATGDCYLLLCRLGAVRSGARSTLATLWSVKDEATAVVMAQFYRELSKPRVTASEALRRFQRSLSSDRRFWESALLGSLRAGRKLAVKRI